MKKLKKLYKTMRSVKRDELNMFLHNYFPGDSNESKRRRKEVREIWEIANR